MQEENIMHKKNSLEFHQGSLPFIGSYTRYLWMIIHKLPQQYRISYFITLPLWMIIRICLIKTLLGKSLWEKTLVKEKEYNILLDYYNCLVKNFASKTHQDKNWTKEKKSAVYPYYHSPPHVNMIMISSTFQMVDLSIFIFQSHTLTFSMWSKVKSL